MQIWFGQLSMCEKLGSQLVDTYNQNVCARLDVVTHAKNCLASGWMTHTLNAEHKS
jgi:hypothetical protein